MRTKPPTIHFLYIRYPTAANFPVWFRLYSERKTPTSAVDQIDLAVAQSALGLMYGRGVEKNFSLAVEWHRKAAEQGLAVSQVWLGVLYSRGNGVEQSYTFAVAWYRKAAVQGHSKAQYNLGRKYERGVLGVAKSNSLARMWYEKAAIQGDDDAKDGLQRLLVLNLEETIGDIFMLLATWGILVIGAFAIRSVIYINS
jgi:TPR repeat protein